MHLREPRGISFFNVVEIFIMFKLGNLFVVNIQYIYNEKYGL